MGWRSSIIVAFSFFSKKKHQIANYKPTTYTLQGIGYGTGSFYTALGLWGYGTSF